MIECLCLPCKYGKYLPCKYPKNANGLGKKKETGGEPFLFVLKNKVKVPMPKALMLNIET